MHKNSLEIDKIISLKNLNSQFHTTCVTWHVEQDIHVFAKLDELV